jgi:TRAP-type C4-dicarboxylate transport system permease small subunit
MDPTDIREAPKAIKPSWKQILALFGAGLVLVPGLCFALASTSSSTDTAVTTMFLLLGLSILLTFIGGILMLIRLVRQSRSRR